jgi:cysteine synthase
MIDLTRNDAQIEKNARLCARQKILLPTYENMVNPETVPPEIVAELRDIGRDDVHSRNLFRVTWENEPIEKGGAYSGVNYLEIPSSLTGVSARIIGLVGKWFPTGSHKVGASYSCLAPELITGHFDPEQNSAVWPSTGNYCRGGAYISRLLACKSVAILPMEMSKERFQWLEHMADETIGTPGCESNVKEIFDKCHELSAERGAAIFIFNQFEQMGNHLWHYEVTGPALEKVLKKELGPKGRLAGTCVSSGSAGTTACGEYLKSRYPAAKLAVSEALQCPTLLSNGFGGHRIEGIGDKHVPWIHNLRNTDMVVAVDDEQTMRLFRLFNEPAGRKYLKERGVDPAVVDQLDLLGISSICNIITAIKFAKYYELNGDDVVMTVFTDSEALYTSRTKELREGRGAYTRDNAIADFEIIQQLQTDALQELSYADQKRVHNLKYYTWVEQQGKTYEEIQAQWYDREYWTRIHTLRPELDRRITEFNEKVLSYMKE